MATRLKYLQSNSKLKNSSVYTYAFNLPAVETCPGAGICKEYCFAASEQKRYPSARVHRERSLELTRNSELFQRTIGSELEILRQLHAQKHTEFAVRIHASGDFYSAAYVQDWISICSSNTDIQFYAYTKSIALWSRMYKEGKVPSNLTIIYSMGSNQDKLIDPNIDRHARIFRAESEATGSGYSLANEDDTAAWQSANNKIGLVIFGATAKFNRLISNQ